MSNTYKENSNDPGIPNWVTGLFAGVLLVSTLYYINLHFIQGYNQLADYREKSNQKHVVGVVEKVKRSPAAISEGASLAAICFGCHGAGLLGTPLAPNLMDSEWLNSATTETELFRIISKGIVGSDLKFGNKATPMPARGLLGGNSDVWKVVYYISSKNTSVKVDSK